MFLFDPCGLDLDLDPELVSLRKRDLKLRSDLAKTRLAMKRRQRELEFLHLSREKWAEVGIQESLKDS